jgi:polygalacturonase
LDKSNALHSDTRRDFLKLAGVGFAGAALTQEGPGPARERSAAAHTAGSFPVTAFGATGDGKAIDTAAINRAIEAASVQGGTVVFPAGSYLSFSLHLKSKVALYLEQGATIIAADTPAAGSEGYDAAEPNTPWEDYQDYGHNHWHNSLIWGESLESVSILGPGLIWGRGLSRGWGAGPKAEDPRVGNKTISLKNCRNVILRDFSILHGGHFGILATGVDNLTIDNLKIDTNRDGMDIDCCRNVRVSNCSVNSPWDDGICLKSSYGLGYARATENVTISDCYVTGTWEEGTLLDGTFKAFSEAEKVPHTGRIKFGTESNGGFKNITVTNCVFEGCEGLALETVDGALLEDVAVTNITMRDIVGAPIFLRLGSRLRGPAGTGVGTLRRVTISNVVCWNASSQTASSVTGIPGAMIEDLSIHDVLIVSKGGGTAEQAALQLPENETKYPEPTMFGTTPVHGFFIRHVRGLSMSNITLRTSEEDHRPALILDDVEGVDLFHLKTPKSAAPTLSMHNVRDFAVRFSEPIPDTRLAHVDSLTLPASLNA